MRTLFGQRLTGDFDHAQILFVNPDAALQISIIALVGVGHLDLWLNVEDKSVDLIDAFAADVGQFVLTERFGSYHELVNASQVIGGVCADVNITRQRRSVLEHLLLTRALAVE